MSSDAYTRLAHWNEDRELIRRIRQTVFVIEQEVDPELEWDGLDAECIHALAGPSPADIVATGRLQYDGKIGRMAVLAAARGQGLGAAILDRLVEAAIATGLDEVYLHAQSHALAFYERHGFVAEGPEFDEANIPHRLMRRSLRGTR
ncbi:MAG: GNAT family N-acetyltransferase [Gammaproteobacteria bacterium]|nr:GNAT family N-acetyltransferase [Gammaproteobacteria bacterium]NNF61285.1 GNAT family N-acetyltransferase [Gammaproteobacteria bacterium]